MQSCKDFCAHPAYLFWPFISSGAQLAAVSCKIHAALHIEYAVCNYSWNKLRAVLHEGTRAIGLPTFSEPNAAYRAEHLTVQEVGLD